MRDTGFIFLLIMTLIIMKLTDFQINYLNKQYYQLEKRVTILEYKMRKCK
jgi:hypothetical protein